ncbi:MAG: hypothetical protein QXS02_04685, partial [Candidatus Thermoplasmatota archaeon]
MSSNVVHRGRQMKLSPIMKNTDSASNICALCRGSKLLCGKSRCPVILRFYSQVKVKPLVSTTYLDGSSPPSVF